MSGLTNFPNGISSMGAPVFGNGIPATFGNTQNAGAGRTFFVNPTTGSDGNSGLSMTKPFTSIGKAISSSTSNNHDVIVLSASSGHAQTTELAMTNSRTHFVGLDAVGRYYGQRSRITMADGVASGATISLVRTTGVGNTFSNIKFDSANTDAQSKFCFADGGEYTVLEYCEIVHSGQLAVTTAAPLLCNGDSSFYHHCMIGSMVHEWTDAGANILCTRETISGKVLRDVTIEDCLLVGKSTSNTWAQIRCTTATDVERFLWIKNTIFAHAKLGSATVAEVIAMTSAQTDGQVLVYGGGQFNHTALGTASDGVSYLGAPIATGATAGDFVAVG
jgi:hypothetical protein